MKPQQASTVPKFSSFKAKKIPEIPQTGEPKPSEPDDDHSRRDGRETRRDSRRPYRNHRRRKEFDVHGQALSEDDTQTAETHGKLLAEYLESDDSFFRVDRKGDPANLTYRGLERSKVPRYHRVGHGRVLGAHPAYCIDRTASNDRWVVLDVPGHTHLDSTSPLQSSRRVFQQSIPPSARFVRSRKDREDLRADGEPFIPLQHVRKRKRCSDTTIGDEEVGYQSIKKPDGKEYKIDISDRESSSG